MRYTLEELCTKKENQVFDRKSARKDAKGLSNHIVAFANADGGTQELTHTPTISMIFCGFPLTTAILR